LYESARRKFLSLPCEAIRRSRFARSQLLTVIQCLGRAQVREGLGCEPAQGNCSCVRNAVCYCSRRSIFRGICRAFCKVTEMLSINGTAIHLTQREFHRAAAGCPMISGRRLLAVAKNYRDFATELDR